MLEGVLKGCGTEASFAQYQVSILGMLEGVLKADSTIVSIRPSSGFNPWYVGGGVKSVGGWVLPPGCHMFQSLVCWRGC